MKILYLSLLFLFSCANVTPSGSKIHLVETEGDSLIEAERVANEFSHKHRCSFVGYIDAKAALFPGSYSLHENEIHSALRNRAAKIGANVVVANFYRKPAQGIGLFCPEEELKE